MTSGSGDLKDVRSNASPWYARAEILVTIVFGIIGTVVAFVTSDLWGPKILGHLGFRVSTPNSQVKYQAEKLRSLEPLETGLSPDVVPDGTYFFLEPYDVEWLTVDYGMHSRVVTSGVGSSGYSFETQKITGQLFLIGYVSDDAYARIGESGIHPIEAVVSPRPWANGQKIVAIPIDGITAVSDRRINISAKETIGVMDMEFRNASQDAKSFSHEVK